MDAYQEKALGRIPEAQLKREAAAEHKISNEGAIILLVLAIILDIVSIFEVPVADVIAWICEIGIIGYLYYVGASQFRQIAANVLAWLAELIPIVDLLPLYTVGIVIVIAIDRNETLRRVAQKVPNPKGGRLPAPKVRRGNMTTQGVAAGGGRPGSRLSQNKIFGAASEKRLAEFDTEWGRLQQKVPGRLMSLPKHKQNRAELGDSNVPGKLRPNRNNPDEIPFPDTYANLEREINPELDDLLAEIDVSGAEVAKTAEKQAANTPNATKQVQ